MDRYVKVCDINTGFWMFINLDKIHRIVLAHKYPVIDMGTSQVSVDYETIKMIYGLLGIQIDERSPYRRNS